jgi:hypothetical protein
MRGNMTLKRTGLSSRLTIAVTVLLAAATLHSCRTRTLPQGGQEPHAPDRLPTGVRIIKQALAEEPEFVQFSPSGRYLGWGTYPEARSGRNLLLEIVELPGGKSWHSPDEESFLGVVWRRDSDTLVSSRILPAQRGLTRLIRFDPPSWSEGRLDLPEGRFAVVPPNPLDSGRGRYLLLFELQPGRKRRCRVWDVANRNWAWESGQTDGAAWIDGQSSLVYSRAGPPSELWVVSIPNRRERFLYRSPSEPLRNLAASREAQLVFFGTGTTNDGSPTEVWQVHLKSGRAQRLDRLLAGVDPMLSVSASGNWLVYSGRRNEQDAGEIVACRVPGASLRRLSQPGVRYSAAAISLNAESIAACRRVDGQTTYDVCLAPLSALPDFVP